MLSPTALKVQRALEEVRAQKNDLVRQENFEAALRVREQEKRLSGRLTKLIEKDYHVHQPMIVNNSDILDVVSQITGIPTGDLSLSEEQRLLNLEKELGQNILGQDEAVKEIARVLRRSRVGLSDPNRPLGSYLFLGPTGVGKSLVAKEMARLLFDDPGALIRIDMSEFSEKHTVSRLIGAPPGYVGYEEGGELTTKLRRRPFSVILLDEIEKAHPDIFNHLLQVLEEGQLVDGKGRVVNFRQSVIVMTSNLGAHLIKKGVLGFGSLDANGQSHEKMKQALLGELKDFFKPEFLNRLDKVVIFKVLSKEIIHRVAKLELEKVREKLASKKLKLEVSKEVFEYLSDIGYSEEYGARPMRRAVQEYIEDPLSEEILKGRYQKNRTVKISLKENQIVFR